MPYNSALLDAFVEDLRTQFEIIVSKKKHFVAMEILDESTCETEETWRRWEKWRTFLYHKEVGIWKTGFAYIVKKWGHWCLQASRFRSNNETSHWNAVKRILKYLKVIKNLGLVYWTKTEMSQVVGYSYSSVRNEFDTRRSMTWNVFLLSDRTITSSMSTPLKQSKKQPGFNFTTMLENQFKRQQTWR